MENIKGSQLSFPASGVEKAEPLDYSKEANWVDIQKWRRKPVDLFYIYPTVAMETRNEDGFASIDEMTDLAIPSV